MAIEASYESLLNQASMTAHHYLIHGIDYIDKTLGSGYAKKHPELLGQFLVAASIDMAGATVAKEIGEALRNIGESLDAIAARMPDTE